MTVGQVVDRLGLGQGRAEHAERVLVPGEQGVGATEHFRRGCRFVAG